jgi:3-oxoacyl-ACP reductase-like protein
MSPAKAAANAANAQHSTGPRTEEGKACSASNAVTHGLTARKLVVRPDQQEEFETLRDALLTEVNPPGCPGNAVV